ncbi:hypothetical protein JHK86_040911 [Glycine max]|nr:hypothetical protein JHK86_040911 [Glycine max]
MASKFSFLTLLMERRKPSKDNNNNNNDLAFVKAAAWAWYQHNSGSKGKTISEFDATITRRVPRPSRYKLEAMRIMAQEAPSEGSPTIRAKKLPLLDEYEVQSISRQLSGLVAEDSKSNNDNKHNKLFKGADNSTNRRTTKKKKVRKGFWLGHGAVCGREEDVVDPGALRVGRRLPAK